MERNYSKLDLSGNYYTTKGFFFFFVPVRVPYGKLFDMARQAGYKVEEKSKIIEKGKSFGNGWIGVKVEGAKENDPDIVTLEGEYNSFEYTGPYKGIGKAYQQVMKDNPDAKHYFSMYLNSPDDVPEAELKTLILFK